MDLKNQKPRVIKRDERKQPPKETVVERMEKRYRAMQSLTNLFKRDLEELKNGHLG